jgi:hypothetical protein
MDAPCLCTNAVPWDAPDDEGCRALWDKYAMPEHIRGHSRAVCAVACHVARCAEERGLDVDVRAVRAAALLHDLAKLYTIEYGGHHGQIGGVWVLEETGNYAVAQGVTHHIHWPWDPDPACCLLPLAVIYGDKRVMHERIVGLDVRCRDLMDRYGKTEAIRERIRASMEQCRRIEERINNYLGTDLNACDFDSGRME